MLDCKTPNWSLVALFSEVQLTHHADMLVNTERKRKLYDNDKIKCGSNKLGIVRGTSFYYNLETVILYCSLE